MTVSVVDVGPKRLLQQSSGPTLAAPVDYLLAMLQTLIEQAVEALFTQFLGAGPH